MSTIFILTIFYPGNIFLLLSSDFIYPSVRIGDYSDDFLESLYNVGYNLLYYFNFYFINNFTYPSEILVNIPYRIENGKAIISMSLPDDVKERIIKRAKENGYSAKPNMGGGVTIFKEVKNELNEVRYSRFKKEAKLRTPTEQIHRAVKEIRQRMNEMLKIVGHTERMKNELKQSNEGMSYLKRTRNALSNISEKLTELNNRIKGLTE